MNIAIIGGGVFGMMTAIRLAERGETVTLFERLPGFMQGTSFNANRLHQGFHYPRDEETARQCVRGFGQFKEEFGSAILADCFNAYFIASEGSLTSPDDFSAFCARIGLAYREIELDDFRPVVTNVELGVLTEEVVYDPAILRRLMTERLRRSGATTRLGSEVVNVHRHGRNDFELSLREGGSARFDAVVNCSYADINRLTAQLGHPIDTRQYEYCAAAIIELDWPETASITVLDGPFMTLLPFGSEGQHLLFHVKHAVIAQDDSPLLNPAWFDPRTSPFALVNRQQWLETQMESCCEFVPALRTARITGVLQAPRMVLAGREDTDARPSIVTAHEPGYVTVFSGKVGHCVWVADEVARKLGCSRDAAS